MSLPLSFFANAVPVQGYKDFGASSVFECAPPNSAGAIQPPSTVPIVILWSQYGTPAGTPNNPISINLQGTVRGAPIDTIRSIKIDNLNCPTTCTVFFPDTGDAVVCAPYSTTRSNVMTGAYQAIVYMPSQTGNNNTQTTIFFNNFQVGPAEINDTALVQNQMIATGSPFQTHFIQTPAMGDRWQRASLPLNLTGAASQVPLFGGPPNGYNFVNLNEIHFRPMACYSDAATPKLMNASIVLDTGATIISWNWYARNDIDDLSGKEILGNVNQQFRNLPSAIGVGIFRKLFLQNNVAACGIAEVDFIYCNVNLVNF